MNLTKEDFKSESIVKGEGFMTGYLNDEAGKFNSTGGALAGKFFGIKTFIDFLLQYCPTPRREGSSSATGSDFHHFDSYEEAIRVYKERPKDILKYDEHKGLLLEKPSKGNEIEHGITGDYIDIGKHLEGDPECFASSINGRLTARFANIVVANHFSGGVNKSTINEMNRELVSLVNWLESNNIRCGIETWCMTETRVLQIVVKHYSEPLSMTDLAVSTHSDFFRRLYFRFTEYSPTWHSGYGNPRDSTSYLRKFVPPIDDNTLWVLIGNEIEYQSPTSIRNTFKTIREMIAKSLEDENKKPEVIKTFV